MIEFLIALAVVGFLVWLILQIPMPGVMHQVIIGVAIFGIVLWVLEGFGVTHFGFPSFHGLK